MNYPLISEYVEAIKAAEDNFDQLRHLRPVLDDDDMPVMSGGNFAVVFKMKDEQTGKLHAVKCFLKEQEGRAEAYRQIAEELEYVSSTFLTPIKYLDKELFVDSANSEDSEFPVLLMDWVEGQTLDKYIREHIDDQYELSLLAYQFSRLAMWLMPQPFAHGDLKPDNILVKEDGTLVLVDYDGMYVPAMKGQKARELGSPDFRHPGRTEEVFDEHIDDFSLASILLSLKAIALQPSLLEEYGASDRLLFSETDYRNLSDSSALGALQPLMQDAELASLYSLYILALSQNNLSQVSFRLFNLSRPENNQGCNIVYLKKRATLGDSNSQFKLGECYLDGDRVEKNYEEAIKWFNKAASSNHAKALRSLAACYIEGKGVKEDVLKGLSLLRQAELYYDKEDVCAIIEYRILAYMKLERYNEVVPLLKEYSQPGKGCRKCSLIKTYNQIERCCPWMQLKLGYCYLNGLGITKNHAQAIDCTIKAAEQGYKEAEYILGLLYEVDDNPDYNKSIEWYTKAATHGSKESSIRLFELYGKKQDYQYAIAWLKKAAEQDEIEAKYLNLLGIFYEEKEDFQESLKWYKKAAERNDAKSQYKLALFYGLGKGITEDLNESKAWLKKAAAQGYDEAIKLLTEEDDLSTEVTEEDLANVWTEDDGKKYCQEIEQLLKNGEGLDEFSSVINGKQIVSQVVATMEGYLITTTLPNTITIIDKYAFKGCDFLYAVKIPNSVTHIEDEAFSNCIRLYSVDIPQSVTHIGESVFCGCCHLESVSIPDSVTYIGNNVFKLCNNIRYIYIPIGKRPQYDNLYPELKSKFVELIDINKKDGWRVKETRPFSPNEIAAVARAEVVPSQYGNSVCFFMNGGGQTYIPLLNYSSLTIGDSVDLKTAKIVTLCREGKDDIYRVIE